MGPALPAHDTVQRRFAELLRPGTVTSRDQALSRPSPVPPRPGIYAWYFDVPPSGVPTAGTHHTEFGDLLYVGISPKEPPRNGKPPSKGNLRARIQTHYRRNASSSTLRLTLGSLLSNELGIQLRRIGSGGRLHFGDGEAALSLWMEEHARVCWMVDPEPWLAESELISGLVLPLNLDQNKSGGFYRTLKDARDEQRHVARSLPVVSR
ncbi:hypothetical protein QQX10_10750 [Demequina sp. SYSU T00039]|uniref:GIY-YIG catalytic domain-containing protein n=1 Tax=Demequina lignilytica TaxID=3051663 RepID=A0AAW7MA54_9MICO|nr:MULTISPECIES: hypothetical protein [unclassified Demequina]MDN4478668.1 hypothetical protein [Demequina sp. SYSU T00039-1]MDN4488646.1 hypothetical protein [Demequina sp. SYSU T00039]